MSREAITAAVGPQAAARLARKCGGAGLYVPQAKRDYSEVRPEQVEQMKSLYLRGYHFSEIAPIVGRSTQTVAGRIRREIWEGRLPCLPSPTTVEGRELRRVLRRLP
jgi:transposase